MYPEICRIGPFTIYSYGLMLAIGFIVSVTLVLRAAKCWKLDSGIIINLTSIAMLFGVIGGRLFYVIEHSGYYLNNPAEIIMLNRGGLSWFGGLILGVLAAILYLRIKRQEVLKYFDLIIPFVALAQGIGRIGCLLNGCCYGRESAWGINFPVHQAVLIPTQLYSSLILVAIFIILRYLQERPHLQGNIFYLYLLLYSVARFFIEVFRADNPAVFMGLSVFQVICIPIFSIALAALLFRQKSR